MFTEITGNELRHSVEEFRKRISSEMSPKGKKTFLFPGGESGEGDNYEQSTSHGLLSIIIVADQEHLNRYRHYINLNQENKVVASDIEINIPKELDRRVSTLLAKDQDHRYICNRGKFTVHMRSLKKSDILEYFATEHRNVFQVSEHNKIASVIRVANIDSKNLFEEIALFTRQVKTFKNRFRNV
jgi:hypothetical protein